MSSNLINSLADATSNVSTPAKTCTENKVGLDHKKHKILNPLLLWVIEKLNGSRCTVMIIKMFFDMLVETSIWQKQSRDFEENKGKISSKKTDIKTFIFYTV